VRQFAGTRKPYLSAEKAYLGGPSAPAESADIKLGSLVHLDVKYPEGGDPIVIPTNGYQMSSERSGAI
jgi:hypothetical protein